VVWSAGREARIKSLLIRCAGRLTEDSAED